MDEEGINHLIETLATTAIELEKSEKFILILSEMIKKGILEAQNELQRENDQKLEEGFIKNLPFVGSLYGLFAGTPEEPKKNTVKAFSLPKGFLYFSFLCLLQVSNNTSNSNTENHLFF